MTPICPMLPTPIKVLAAAGRSNEGHMLAQQRQCIAQSVQFRFTFLIGKRTRHGQGSENPGGADFTVGRQVFSAAP